MTKLRLAIIISLLGGLAVGGYLLNDHKRRDDAWQNVQDAEQHGLPATAIMELERIYNQAILDKAYPEAIKAISKKITLEGVIEGNRAEERVLRMQQAIENAPKEMVPVMDAILANWYLHYFHQNRWRLMNRSATSEPSGKDMLTWDLTRILAQIDIQFTKALRAEKELKQIPIAEYDALLEKGSLPDKYRPTLYDFVAQDALTFYNAGEQAGSKSEDAYELSAESPVFASAKDFAQWEVKSTDQDSHIIKALHLYQQLLRFHENDTDRTAYLDVDLARLHFGNNHAVGEEKAQSYKTALTTFIEKNQTHELSAEAQFRLATQLHTAGDFLAAHKLAKLGETAFPDSVGGKRCFNLIQQIEAKSLEIGTERVWNQPWPGIRVRYRNVTEVHFRILKVDWMKRMAQGYLSDADRNALLSMKPEFEWSAKLSATEDFQERTEQVDGPKDIPAGYYQILASHNSDFSGRNNFISSTSLWVSNLSIVMRERPGEGTLEGFVLHALTGEPIAAANVQIWSAEYGQALQAGPKVKTDKNGLFSSRVQSNRNYFAQAEYQGDTLTSGSDHIYESNQKPSVRTRIVFFTDRAIYRPGQTVSYKGICIFINPNQDNYQTIPNQKVVVLFQDRNGKNIAQQDLVTNDYGSFKGSFRAPSDRLMGAMTIRTQNDPQGQVRVQIEEYKRPKFQVALDKPKVAGKLNAPVELLGKATAYTGAAIDRAKVKYRVVREVRYPDWFGTYYWWRPVPPQTSQEIVHGVTTTHADGTFPITFTARPDRSVPEMDEPTFQYTVYADVTDSTGETRSGQQTLRMGYTALKASLTAADWQTAAKPVEVRIRTTSLDDEPQATKVKLKVFALRQPEKVQRAFLEPPSVNRFGKNTKPAMNPTNPDSWELGEEVGSKEVSTEKTGEAVASFKLPVGVFRVLLEAEDRFGKKISARRGVSVMQPDAKVLALKLPNLVLAPSWTVEPGQVFTALWGSGYDKARAFIEVEHRGKIVQSYWTDPNTTQQRIQQKITEAMRGGFTLRLSMVRENRAYLMQRHVDVPWSNKNLTVKWEHFVSKLEPGQKETYTAVITGPDARRAEGEMVASLYDEALDQFLPHHWLHRFDVFRQDYSQLHCRFENSVQALQHFRGNWEMRSKMVEVSYRHYPSEVIEEWWANQLMHDSLADAENAVDMPKSEVKAKDAAPKHDFNFIGGGGMNAPPGAGITPVPSNGKPEPQPVNAGAPGNGAGAAPTIDLNKVAARKNLNETAFFEQQLVSNEEGIVKLVFTMPEALTQWKFLGFVHDKELRSGFLQDKVVTARQLMIQPNSPRFVRAGDEIEFTVKVSNQSEQPQRGQVRLTFADARTGKSVDDLLAIAKTDQSFDIPAKESQSFAWKMRVPDGLGPITYKAVGSTDKLSDGEEGAIPTLSRRVLVTESMPLPIRGITTKKFDFAKLRESATSPSIQQQSLTVQMVSQPAWYAVMALPYLMEYPYECAEQQFNRYYANALAKHIAASDPKIRRIFDAWMNTPALDSPLEKNRELKLVTLEETPWYRQAQSESQARKNIGILFDDQRLTNEMNRVIQKLKDTQMPDGLWPWFPGGRGNEFISLYIATGFGRLRNLGAPVDTNMATQAWTGLDGWLTRTHQEILKRPKPDENHLSNTIALYLYGRSFFLKDKAIAPENKAAFDYFTGQAKKYWFRLPDRQSQAQVALGLFRLGEKEAAQGILKSIKERSKTSDEMGMYWRDTERSQWWYRAPIETQAMMIEAFTEIGEDAQAVEDCKVWLLKQKQTQDWKTTKATADAVYALLLRGENLLKSEALVEVTLGDTVIHPQKTEAGTGFYEERFVRAEVRPIFGNIQVKKTDEGVAWGSVHWQYLEDVSKVTPHIDNPLKLKKTLWVRKSTKKGPLLEPVRGALEIGDEIVVRVELRSDRDMEYVHLKDGRGSGTEPMNVLSRYRYQDGLGYYETTRDTASHFFIDYLPKGTYVFEYSVRIVHKGKYQTGMAEIQCMYAPEFNSHSESLPMEVK